MDDRQPFASLPATPGNHFRLHFYAAAAQVLATARLFAEGWEPLAARLALLRVYETELEANGVPTLPAAATASWWSAAITEWESRVSTVLPMRAVREAFDLDPVAMIMLAGVGLIEEDAGFGAVYEALNGVPGQFRPTGGALAMCWNTTGEVADSRARLRRLVDAGLLRTVGAEAPRLQRAFEVPGALWDALSGDRPSVPVPWARHIERDTVTPLDAIVLPRQVRDHLARAASLVASGDLRVVVARGPQHNGRHAALSALAHAAGRGVLSIADAWPPDDPRWREAAALAAALHALPIVTCDLAPGQTVELPRSPAFPGSLGVVIGRAGGLGSVAAERTVVVDIGLPARDARRQLWRTALAPLQADVAAIAEHHRFAAGYICRAAAMMRTRASLGGVTGVQASDVAEAARALNSQALDTLATRLPVAGNWTALAIREDTLRELVHLERRCRHRERLAGDSVLGGTGDAGVRGLFRGPSGTGKTLAARVLAAVLDKDLYRVDLSALVNKYIGETEKNLERVLARAEELDVVLLFDEGDALLTQRTGVSNANDRYANLETNFLLQRLETFEGILIVTTNAGERIDAAFERRMDVVVEFQPPQAAERWDLWQLHLSASHRVDAEFLNEVATRCTLSGGQIRNAVLHASLLAVDAGGEVDSTLLDAAVRREYRKAGAVCPLRVGPMTMAGA
jgi:hypothetical protein